MMIKVSAVRPKLYATSVWVILSLFLSSFFSMPAFAISKADTGAIRASTNKKDTCRQIDLMDIMHTILHKGGSSANADSVGVKPVISMVPAIGYAMSSRMAILLTGNVAFRTGPQSRISLVNFTSSYNQNRQFTMPLMWNIWNKNNSYDFTGEMRYYSYPQNTFGLGSKTNVIRQNPMTYNYLRFSETVLRHVVGNFYAGAGYIMDNHWGITHQTESKTSVSDFAAYGAASHTVSSGLSLNGFFDSRDGTINPSKGFYAMYQYRQNLQALGSTAAWSSIVLDVRKYLRFPASSKNVLAFWSYNWMILSGKPPYLDLPATLWDANSNTGRGYVQGRFRGAQMVYLETEYRFRITANGLIGGVLFANGQSFSAAPGTHLQAMQPGFGPGLRVKLNKASKTNIAIDYGIGREGSKGLFVNIGELF